MTYYVAAKGFVRNPLRPFRNIACPCDSGKKAKRCHGAEPFMREAEAEQAKSYLRSLSMFGFIKVRPGDIT